MARDEPRDREGDRMTARFIALTLFATAVLPQLGCSSDGVAVNASDDSFTTVANGLWALDGDADHGDIELLQLDQRAFTSLTHKDEAAPQAARAAARASTSAPANASQAAPPIATGSLARAAHTTTAPVFLTVGDVQYTVGETPDTLTLTSQDGRVLTYHRSYRLYCVDNDRSVEATVVLELGKEPKVVGVNGDGRTFPGEGTFSAAVQSDVLFRLEDYVITSDLGNGSLVTVKLPWADMNKPLINGSIAISGLPNSAPPTALSCERVFTPAIPATP